MSGRLCLIRSASFMTKTVQYQNELHKFLIWDTAGQERVSKHVYQNNTETVMRRHWLHFCCSVSVLHSAEVGFFLMSDLVIRAVTETASYSCVWRLNSRSANRVV